MTTALPTLREHRMPRRRRSRSTLPRLSVPDLTIRIVLAAALVGGVVWMLVQADTVRAAEAHFAAWWMDGWIPGGVTASADTYMLWLDDSHLVGFQVTAECTALILLVPLLALGACFVLSARVSVPRAIAGTKEMLLAGHDDSSARYESLIALSAQQFSSPEDREGGLAFLERRPPSWAPDAP
jgi:hypothetical protein